MADVQKDAQEERVETDEDGAADDDVSDRRDAVIAKLSADLDALREHKEVEVAAVREECDEVRAAFEERIAQLEDKLREVYTSETWKAGRAVLWLPRKVMGKRQPPDEWDG